VQDFLQSIKRLPISTKIERQNYRRDTLKEPITQCRNLVLINWLIEKPRLDLPTIPWYATLNSSLFLNCVSLAMAFVGLYVLIN
jgi:hypothetical protein